jgi:hypothetical protein
MGIEIGVNGGIKKFPGFLNRQDGQGSSRVSSHFEARYSFKAAPSAAEPVRKV